MTIGLRINGKTDVSDFVKSVTLSGDTSRISRTLNVSMVATANGRTRAYTINEGDQVTFRYDGAIRFTGIVFKVDITSSGDYSLTCYDPNIYLVKSHDSKIHKSVTATQMIRRIAGDFGVPVGDMVDTGYVIPYYRANNKALSEVMLAALKLTRTQVGRSYFIGNAYGKLTLYAVTDTTRYVLKSGTNLISAQYSRSIEDTKTQAKVVGGPKGKEIVVIAKNETLRGKYGVLQAYEEMDEKATLSQVKQRAATILKEQAVVSESLRVEAMGVIEIDVGSVVYVRNEMTSTNGAYYVSSFSHEFGDATHTMSLDLTRTFELPDITINDDELKPEVVKTPKATTKKKSTTNTTQSYSQPRTYGGGGGAGTHF